MTTWLSSIRLNLCHPASTALHSTSMSYCSHLSWHLQIKEQRGNRACHCYQHFCISSAGVWYLLEKHLVFSGKTSPLYKPIWRSSQHLQPTPNRNTRVMLCQNACHGCAGSKPSPGKLMALIALSKGQPIILQTRMPTSVLIF